MKREPEKLHNTLFDLVVIGAGINGAAIAWEAVNRGYSVALIDKGDFGGATSSGCFKIVHGGLRYLQHLDFNRLLESVKEQKVLRQIAPHLVHPLPFIVPCYGYGMRGKETLRVALSLYEAITCFRNSGIEESHKLPNHKVFTRDECLEVAPGINPEGLRGAIVFHDAQMSNCERLTFSFAASASEEGGVVCNYVEAKRFLLDESSQEVGALQCRDLLIGREVTIQGKFFINATGPWAMRLSQQLCGKKFTKPETFSKGVQVVLSSVASKYGLSLESSHIDSGAVVRRGGRSYFIVPWCGRTLLGTADWLHIDGPDKFSITEEEIETLLGEARRLYKTPLFNVKNVEYVFGGLRPVEKGFIPGKDKQIAPVSKDDEIIDHSTISDSVPNLISVIGVKYTTCRALAEKVVSRVGKMLKQSVNTCLLYTSDAADEN